MDNNEVNQGAVPGASDEEALRQQLNGTAGNAPAPEGPEAHPVEFSPLEAQVSSKPEINFNLLMDVSLKISVQLGDSKVLVKDLLKMGQGSVVELEKTTNEPVDILVNGKPFAKGEIVVIEDNFGVRITEIASPQERINSIQ